MKSIIIPILLLFSLSSIFYVNDVYAQIPDLDCQPITDLSFFGKHIEEVNIGETKKAVIDFIWDGNSNLRIGQITSIEDSGINLNFQTPLEFTPSISGQTISEIPYVIEVLPNECTDEQNSSCVFDETSYDIPITMIIESCEDIINFDESIQIKIMNDEFPWELLTFIVVIKIIIIYVIIKRRKQKPKTSHMELHHKPRDRRKLGASGANESYLKSRKLEHKPRKRNKL